MPWSRDNVGVNGKILVLPPGRGMTKNPEPAGRRGRAVVPDVTKKGAPLIKGSEVVKAPPLDDKNYVDYFTTTFSDKIKEMIDVKQIIGQEALDKNLLG
jgi:hypothetical protein